MAEPRRFHRRLAAALAAFVVALAAVAVLVYCLGPRDDARAELTSARHELRSARAASSAAATDLAAAHRVLRDLQPQLQTLAPAAAAVATLEEQDLASVRAALAAGLAGNLTGYNQAVDQRAAIAPEPDTALEQLRQQANVIITALDQLRG